MSVALLGSLLARKALTDVCYLGEIARASCIKLLVKQQKLRWTSYTFPQHRDIFEGYVSGERLTQWTLHEHSAIPKIQIKKISDLEGFI